MQHQLATAGVKPVAADRTLLDFNIGASVSLAEKTKADQEVLAGERKAEEKAGEGPSSARSSTSATRRSSSSSSSGTRSGPSGSCWKGRRRRRRLPWRRGMNKRTKQQQVASLHPYAPVVA